MQNSIQIILYNDSQHRDKTIHLWKQVFAYDTAHNEPHLVLDRKLALQDDLLFLAVDGEAVLGTIMAGYDFKALAQNWLNMQRINWSSLVA
mgnify:CR=1 FL=1